MNVISAGSRQRLVKQFQLNHSFLCWGPHLILLPRLGRAAAWLTVALLATLVTVTALFALTVLKMDSIWHQQIVAGVALVPWWAMAVGMMVTGKRAPEVA